MDRQTYVIYLHNGLLSANERNEISIHVTIGVNLPNTVLNERSQAQKSIYCMFHSYEGNRQIYKTESRSVLAKG